MGDRQAAGLKIGERETRRRAGSQRGASDFDLKAAVCRVCKADIYPGIRRIGVEHLKVNARFARFRDHDLGGGQLGIAIAKGRITAAAELVEITPAISIKIAVRIRQGRVEPIEGFPPIGQQIVIAVGAIASN